jgi:radical SAM/Cys-rich protein
MPISRFLEFLLRSGNYQSYMEKLVTAFNPSTVPGLMCRNTISIGWDGYLYDCDFNQMLDLKIHEGIAQKPMHVKDFDSEYLDRREIIVSQHCYGCTAGAGSSCRWRGGEIKFLKSHSISEQQLPNLYLSLLITTVIDNFVGLLVTC